MGSDQTRSAIQRGLIASRRSVLARFAQFVGFIAFPLLRPGSLRALENPKRFDPALPRFLTPAELAFVTAAVDRLLPADDRGPGGVAAQVPRFIDVQLAGPWGRGDARYNAGPFKPGPPTLGDQLKLSRADLYRQTIKALRLTPRGKDFERASKSDQEAFLTSLQQGSLDSDTLHGSAFFTALLTDCVQGFMSDPRYGGNAGFIGWKLMGYPGLRYDWTPYLQNDGRKLDLPIVGAFGPLDGYGLN